jgi:hypothetical protein
VARLREALQGKPEEATYPERIRLGELVAEALAQKREEDQDFVLGRISRAAVAVEPGEPMHERMATNASFLVERRRLPEFDRALEDVAAELGGRIRFKYTGPLPPHSFVELSLEA